MLSFCPPHDWFCPWGQQNSQHVVLTGPNTDVLPVFSVFRKFTLCSGSRGSVWKRVNALLHVFSSFSLNALVYTHLEHKLYYVENGKWTAGCEDSTDVLVAERCKRKSDMWRIQREILLLSSAFSCCVCYLNHLLGLYWLFIGTFWVVGLSWVERSVVVFGRMLCKAWMFAYCWCWCFNPLTSLSIMSFTRDTPVLNICANCQHQ